MEIRSRYGRQSPEEFHKEVCLGRSYLTLIFLNDLFCHIKDVNIHAYADDGQLHYSDVDPRALEQRILHLVQIANQWYTENGMIVNPDKHHHAMVLGTIDHKFSFPVEDSLDLLGMTIDNQ